MKTFDELLAMTDDERLFYLETEVESVILNAPARVQLKLRAVHAKCNNIRRTIKNPLVRAAKMQSLMLDSMFELQAQWNGLKDICNG